MMALRTLLVVTATALGAGCFTVNADLPGTLRGDVETADTERVGVMKLEKTHWFFVWGLVGEAPPNFVAEDIKKSVQQKGADGVANLTYESQFGCVDLVIFGVTAGCVAPRTYRVSGDLVRIKKAPPPGKPAKVADSAGPAVDREAWRATQTVAVRDTQAY